MKDELLDKVFATLGNKQRITILQYLNHAGERSVSEICDDLELEQSAVSHNMRRLLSHHFVKVEPRGKERLYSINTATVQPMFELVGHHMRTHCAKDCHHRK